MWFSPHPYTAVAMLAEVVARTAATVAGWQTVRSVPLNTVSH